MNKKFIVSMMLFISCLGLTGCSDDFHISHNIYGRNLIYKHYLYYVKEKNNSERFIIRYKNRDCAIQRTIQNKDKVLLAVQVECIPFMSTLKIGSRKTNIPLRYILLISGNKVIYKAELKTVASLKMNNEDQLLITYPYYHQRVLVSNTGKEIQKIHYKDKELTKTK